LENVFFEAQGIRRKLRWRAPDRFLLSVGGRELGRARTCCVFVIRLVDLGNEVDFFLALAFWYSSMIRSYSERSVPSRLYVLHSQYIMFVTLEKLFARKFRGSVKEIVRWM
jgi:hypothetical protein